MSKVHVRQDPQVKTKFESYPEGIRQKLEHLRALIMETASEEGLEEIEETLKWGEPSYASKKGSPIRIDWKPRSPHQYAMYFVCTSTLVATFKMVHGDLFKYEKNRAILLDLQEEIPEAELKECIKMALKYHLLKKDVFLGK